MKSYIQGLEHDPEFIGDIKKICSEFNIKTTSSKKASQAVVKRVAELTDDTSFEKEIGMLCNKYGFKLFWGSWLRSYIFYNVWIDNILTTEAQVVDMQTQFFIDKNLKKLNTVQAMFAEMIPVAIQFSAYLSQNDLVKFIRANYESQIKPYQEKYKDGLKTGKYRGRSSKTQERNDFIYKNRELGILELTRLVNSSFRKGKCYDYTYVQKILKDEMKKRK